jgi:hypothetical protein
VFIKGYDMYKLIFLTGVFAFLFFTACASTGVVPMDGNTFMIAKKSAQFGAGPPVMVQADVYREANEYCAKENKEVETVKLDIVNSGFGRAGSVSLEFRCK